MRVSRRKQQNGWTLLELLLVLVCVIALSAILLYSFITPVNRQVSMRELSSQLSELVNAAHLWRHTNNNSYAGISMDQLKQQGLISEKWNTREMQNQFTIQSLTSQDYVACLRADSCIAITVFPVPKSCEYVVRVNSSGDVATIPSYNQCANNPERFKGKSFIIIYE